MNERQRPGLIKGPIWVHISYTYTHTPTSTPPQLQNANTDKLHTELKDMHRLFGSVLAFIIAFRTNNAYQSYVEGKMSELDSVVMCGYVYLYRWWCGLGSVCVCV